MTLVEPGSRMTTRAVTRWTSATAAAARRRPEAVGASCAAVGAATVALALVSGPRAALVPALLIAVVAGGCLAVTRPRVVLVVLVVSEFTNASVLLQPYVPVSLQRALFALGMLTLVATLRDPVSRARLRRPLLIPLALMVVYLCSVVPSALVSEAPGSTAVVLSGAVQDASYLVLVLLLAQAVEAPWLLLKAVVVPLAVLAGLTLVDQLLLGNATSFGGFASVSDALGDMTTTARHAGPTTDPNFWGRNLLLGLPFGFALTQRAWLARDTRATLWWASSTVAILAGIYLTQSRGAMISLGVVAVSWILLAGPAARRFGMAIMPVALLLLLAPGIGDRLLTLTQIDSSSADLSLVGRVAAQEMGWAMFGDRPVLGVGPGAFKTLIPDYAPRSSAASDVIGPLVDAPHDLYLQLLAETGVVGAAGWIILVLGMLLIGGASFVRLVSTRRMDGDAVACRGAVAAAIVSVLGWSIASLFLHMAYARELFVVFAVVALFHRYVQDGGPPGLPVWKGASDVRSGGGSVAVLGLAGAALAAAAILQFGSQPSFVASQRLVLGAEPGPTQGYASDVLSRTEVVPTIAGMIPRADAGVAVDGSAASSLITVTARDGDRARATRRVVDTTRAASAALRRPGARTGYLLEPVAAPVVLAERSTPDAVRQAAVWTAVLLSALTVLAVRRRRRSLS